MNTAGARPAQRTQYDRRVIHQTRARMGNIIDSQEVVGGYPTFEPRTHELSIPSENFTEWLNEFTRAVETRGVNSCDR
jgi:truncated hemoglobin YjbI